MSDDSLERALAGLTDIQREAVRWNNGALLVLAGPGSGKTRVLTCRIARLLNDARDKSFRILALTFTNKAADEMKDRLTALVPGLEDRANIGTFHSFCGQVLRQHGVHIGIKPDFDIYALDEDRRAVLEEALRRASERGKPVTTDDVRYLALIDRLKVRLISPEHSHQPLSRAEDRERITLTYQLYEDELRRTNALDFNSLILEAYKLMAAFPAIAARYRRSYPYWLIDEFQDTNDAQYRFVRAMAGDGFRNIFAVADDDQIIYQWNGASFRQIQRFRSDYESELIQLPTNYRCPPAIVEAANRLVAYNANRTLSKIPLLAGKTNLRLPPEQHIQYRAFETDDEETDAVAQEIANRGNVEWAQVTVLARTRALLDRMQTALQKKSVASVIAQRRDEFLSPEFRWLAAGLKQAVRPLDRRNMAVFVEAFNRMAGTGLSVEQVIADAEASSRSYLATWVDAASVEAASSGREKLVDLIAQVAHEPSKGKKATENILSEFEAKSGSSESESDLAEDLAAWREISRDIAKHLGHNAPLDQFLQQLQLRSKEPSPKPATVTLMTVHGAKGREFDIVYVIGLAEDILPSFQSRQKGDTSPEMEEERRNCFVAITRAKECLVLTYAKHYRGWQKQPSRFLVEMGIAA